MRDRQARVGEQRMGRGGWRTRGVVVMIVVLTVLLALFEGCLVRGELLVGGDLLGYYYPRWEAFGDALAAGSLPLWNPLAGSGSSWLGPRAAGPLYPGNVLFALMPIRLAMGWFLYAHLALACEGARRFMRGVSFRAALATGLAYCLGGFLVSMLVNPVYLVSGAWLPWAAMAGTRFGADPAQLRPCGVGALSVAMCLLAGEPQGAIMAAVVFGAFCVAGCRSNPKRVLGWAMLALVIGVAAAGPTVVSTLSELPFTDRSLGSWTDTRFGLEPGVFVDFAFPGALGTSEVREFGFWGFAAYGDQLPWCSVGIGTLGLALAVTALRPPMGSEPPGLARIRRHGLILLGAGVLAAWLAPGAAISLRFPAKWLVLSALGLACLVGVGFERWRLRGPPRSGPVVLALLGALALVGAAVASRTSAEWFVAPSHGVDGAAARAATVHALLRVVLISSPGLGLAWAWRRLGARRATLLLGLLVFDLLTSARPMVSTTSTPVLEPPAMVQQLRAAASPPLVRLHSRTNLLQPEQIPDDLAGLIPQEQIDLLWRDALAPNRGNRFGVRGLDAFSTVRSRARVQLFESDAWRRLHLPFRYALLDAEFVPLPPAS